MGTLAEKPTHHLRYVDDFETFDADVTLSDLIIEGLQDYQHDDIPSWARRSLNRTFRKACYKKYGKAWELEHLEVNFDNISKPHSLPQKEVIWKKNWTPHLHGSNVHALTVVRNVT